MRFLGIMGRKNGVCVGRCMCSRNHGGRKVILKKRNLRTLSGILGQFKTEFRKKRYVVILMSTRSGRMQISKKKKKKKKFLMGQFPSRFFYFR